MRSLPDHDTPSTRMACLRKTLLFADLPEGDLLVLSASLQRSEFHKGQPIFWQGHQGHELYVVMRGKVRTFKTTPAGHETTLNILFPGDVLGECAVLDGRPHPVTAVATAHCSLLGMAGDVFLQHLQAMPALALGVARLLTSKLRWMATYAETIAQYDAAGRLLHILLYYNRRFGEEQEPGRRYVLNLALNQADLASLVGARREWVNRILHDWRQRDLIAYDAGRIVILDLPRVQQERDRRMAIPLDQEEW
ncbi:MAG: Crp/Fnr family transcriptional regulator [Chloroflexi bacterium]|nr:Crp/Fnr family transcriptional regulator [Chloroflexota bacterium]MBU1751102.1 Crp/Fnr family transcriptional regulator [Chloroflexota bacterium]